MKHFYTSRLAAFLLLLVTCFATAHAQTFTVDGISYSVYYRTEIKVVAGEEPYSGDIVIPDTVTVDSVTYTVTMIGSNAFQDCEELTSVSLPNTLQEIQTWAFDGCSSLVEITIPESVTSIGFRAFDGCSDLETVILPDGLTSLSDELFRFCTSLEEINLPANLESIGSGCFMQCTSLSSVEIPESVQTIGFNAFYYCTSLKGKIHINAKTIGDKAFYACNGITEVTFGDNVESIGSQAFQGPKITTLVLGKNVTTLGPGAFDKPYYITLNDVITDLNGAFNNCYIYSITLNTPIPPTGISITNLEVLTSANVRLNGEWTEAYEQADGWKDFYYIVAEWDKSKATLIDGIYYNFTSKSTAEVVAGENAYSGDITIPATIEHEGTTYNVTAIRSEAFKNSSIKSVSLPEGLEEIGVAAFSGCTSIRDIAFPNSLTRLRPRAFNGTTNLEKITWGTGLTALEGLTFTKYHNSSASTNITIPSTITSFDLYDFGGWIPMMFGSTIVVTLESATPPANTTNLFEDGMSYVEYGDAILNIPQGSREAYMAVSPWNMFGTINEMLPSGVESIESDGNIGITVDGNVINVAGTTGITVHDTAGRLIYSGKNTPVTVPAGIYIVNDGNSSHKVIVRN